MINKDISNSLDNNETAFNHQAKKRKAEHLTEAWYSSREAETVFNGWKGHTAYLESCLQDSVTSVGAAQAYALAWQSCSFHFTGWILKDARYLQSLALLHAS